MLRGGEGRDPGRGRGGEISRRSHRAGRKARGGACGGRRCRVRGVPPFRDSDERGPGLRPQRGDPSGLRCGPAGRRPGGGTCSGL